METEDPTNQFLFPDRWYRKIRHHKEALLGGCMNFQIIWKIFSYIANGPMKRVHRLLNCIFLASRQFEAAPAPDKFGSRMSRFQPSANANFHQTDRKGGASVWFKSLNDARLCRERQMINGASVEVICLIQFLSWRKAPFIIVSPGVIRMGSSPVWKWKTRKISRTKEAQWAGNGPVWMPQAVKTLCFTQFWN